MRVSISLSMVLFASLLNGADLKPFDLGKIEIVDSAGKSDFKVLETISAEDIKESNSNTVAEALENVAGIVMTTNIRHEKMINVRGFDIRRTPLFVDGIPVYVPYDGYPDLSMFNTADISEIQVSKGFSSALFGANTLAGAINIVTKKPKKEFEGVIEGGIFSGEGKKSIVDFGTRQKDFYAMASFSTLQKDYFRLSDDFVPTANEDGAKRDNSFYKNQKINLKAGYTPNSDEYSINYIKQDGEKYQPIYTGDDTTQKPRYWRWPYWDKESIYFLSKTDFANSYTFKSRLYYDKFQNSLFSYDDNTYTTQNKKSSFKSAYDDYATGGSLELAYRASDKLNLAVAYHIKNDFHKEWDPTKPDLEMSDMTQSLGFESVYKYNPNLAFVVGGSYDFEESDKAEYYNEKTKSVDEYQKGDSSSFNPQIGLFYYPIEDAKTYITVAKKSRFPSIKDRYSLKFGTYIENPDLKAEKSINYEIGGSYNLHDNFKIEADIFYVTTDDFIQAVANAKDNLFQMQNIAKEKHYGFENGMIYLPTENLELGLKYAYIEAKNDEDDSFKIIDIPKHRVDTSIKYHFTPSLYLFANLVYESERFSQSNGKFKTDDYTIINSKMSYNFSKNVNANIGATNIFDENYELTEGLPQAGREFYANLSYRF